MATIVANPTEAIVKITSGKSSRCNVNQRVIQPKTQIRKKTYVTRLRKAISRNEGDCLDQPKKQIIKFKFIFGSRSISFPSQLCQNIYHTYLLKVVKL